MGLVHLSRKTRVQKRAVQDYKSQDLQVEPVMLLQQLQKYLSEIPRWQLEGGSRKRAS
jgi:hypothetical protein